MISGCDNVAEIYAYGVKKFDFLTTFLDLDNGVPSHDTIGRVFSLLDPQEFGDRFANWTEPGPIHPMSSASSIAKLCTKLRLPRQYPSGKLLLRSSLLTDKGGISSD